MKTIPEKIIGYLKYTDKLLWLLLIIINAYSLVLISSMQRASDYNYLRTQIIALAIGTVGAIILSCIDYKYIHKLWWLAALGGLALIGVVLLFGENVEGTDDTAWISIGSFSLQPSELVKICFIVTFSAHLSYVTKANKLKSFWQVCLLALHAAVPVLLIHLQGDDGSALIFIIMFAVMMFAAGVQIRYFVLSLAAVGVCAPLIWTYVMNDDQRNRFLVLLDLDGNSDSAYAWQQYQGKLSMVSGGFTGTGLYHGTRVESSIVPEQANDFIFTVAGEELGFIGCCAILLLFVLLLLRIFFKAATARDEFGQYICIGVFSLVLSQAVVNIGMVLGFLPVVGVTLPFFSAGGTSLMCLMLCMGMVQSVNIYSNEDRLIIVPHSMNEGADRSLA